MDSVIVPGPPSSNPDKYSNPVPDSSRCTSHAGRQGGLSSLSYGLAVVWRQLRPFIPFLLISCMILALIYVMQAIIYGGPFKDPLFFVKFNERWPRPAPGQQESLTPTKAPGPIPSLFWEEIAGAHRDNETI